MIKHKLCTNPLCAHEWDVPAKSVEYGYENKCSWCGSPGRTIEVFRPWSMESMLALVDKMRKEREEVKKNGRA